MKRLDKEQAIIITGYTGKLCCNFDDFHKDIERRLNRPVQSAELAFLDTPSIYREDFLKLCSQEKDNAENTKSEFGIKFFEERYKLGELTKDIEESLHGETRSQIKKQKMKNTPLRIAVIVEEAINLQEKFNKELKSKESSSEQESGK